ncbi:hypothetical protein [Nonomuraea cavernae]|uniref:Uncharacterized protein n=1 Tax=Nonomuraea cavernae TaxID=2045107 RepID=A0A917YUI5_9ACTN|nr:hypothetical protein [Nonomuraea cavernae]MCA2190799.1 hypothetical protein [Nonomuraea cavernae]GGO67033.1 hypothetical protein GCM10012289_22550 [Nonomuraea cavernae]
MNDIDFRGTPYYLDFADHEEVEELLSHWGQKGMKFRWPADDNWEYYQAFEAWGEVCDALLAQLGNNDALKKQFKEMGEKNDGVALDAFVAYWNSIPLQNAREISHSSEVIRGAVWAVNRNLSAFKETAMLSLLDLKKALDDTEGWWWSRWFSIGVDRSEVEKKSRSLVHEFDLGMKPLTSQLEQNVGQARELIVKQKAVLEQIAKPMPKNLGLGP